MQLLTEDELVSASNDVVSFPDKPMLLSIWRKRGQRVSACFSALTLEYYSKMHNWVMYIITRVDLQKSVGATNQTQQEGFWQFAHLVF